MLGYDVHRVTGHIGTTLIQNDFIVTDTSPRVLNVGDIVTFKHDQAMKLGPITDRSGNDAFFVLHRQRSQTPVLRSNIHGKVVYIWFSWDSGIRWERFPKYVPDR